MSPPGGAYSVGAFQAEMHSVGAFQVAMHRIGSCYEMMLKYIALLYKSCDIKSC